MKRALPSVVVTLVLLSALMAPTFVRADGPVVSSGGGKPPILLQGVTKTEHR